MDLRYSRDELRFSGVEDFSRYRENCSHRRAKLHCGSREKDVASAGLGAMAAPDRPAAHGGDMTRMKWMRRASLAATFALALSLAAPAQAAGWSTWTSGPGIIQEAWQWIAGLWSAPEGGGRPARDLSKEGSGCDPLGSPCNCSKAGSGVDPLGGPSNPSPPPSNTQGNAGDGGDPGK